MTLGALLLLHLMAGLGVAVAVYVTAPGRPGERAFLVASAILFWPMYLPGLLTARDKSDTEARHAGEALPPQDDLAAAIAQADAELESALHSLDGWAEHVLAREKDRLEELRRAWIAQADRIRSMDALLRSEGIDIPIAVFEDGSDARLTDRLRASQQVIRQNHNRLRQVRERTLDDLLGTLAWVRELVSMIHLAKFTGAPATRAEELVAQIAASVEGLSALTWSDEDSVPADVAATRALSNGERRIGATR